MANLDRGTRLTDPHYCIAETNRLLIPVSEDNWELVAEDAADLNVLQATIAHLVYQDAERESFQEQVMGIVFTAYLLGRSAEERAAGPTPDVFAEWIERRLDLSALIG